MAHVTTLLRNTCVSGLQPSRGALTVARATSADGSQSTSHTPRRPVPHPQDLPEAEVQEAPAPLATSLAEALNRQREHAAEFSGRKPPLKPQLPAHYGALPPRTFKSRSLGAATQVWYRKSGASGPITAEPRSTGLEALPVLPEPISVPDSVRQAKRDALAPKTLPGMGA
ncbi:hypothetical protein WJX73_009068 [Symbiochloris irregularis]|uniref:Uncharacterized protein n=1 Tax=Symbiochloris irregularis TaxID=706552 RepID=A0AAW1P5Z4_9CHLO